MDSLKYYINLSDYNINEFNNQFFMIYLIIGLLLFFGFLTFFKDKNSEQNNNKEFLNYLEEMSYNKNLLEKCRKILFPNKGETVTILSGKWKDLIGHITKYDDNENQYNIKIFKSDNLNTNLVPKRRISRKRSDFIVNSGI